MIWGMMFVVIVVSSHVGKYIFDKRSDSEAQLVRVTCCAGKHQKKEKDNEFDELEFMPGIKKRQEGGGRCISHSQLAKFEGPYNPVL